SFDPLWPLRRAANREAIAAAQEGTLRSERRITTYAQRREEPELPLSRAQYDTLCLRWSELMGMVDSAAEPLGSVGITEVLRDHELRWVDDVHEWLRHHPKELAEFSADVFVPLTASATDAFRARMISRMNRLREIMEPEHE